MADARAASPLDAALSRVGDRWALLVVHALLGGPRRFSDLIEGLPGIAPNILSHRLKHLEREGVVTARPYSRRPPRLAYELTAAGAELAGTLRLLAQWGAGRSEDAEALHHAACGTTVEVRWYCPTCGRAIDDDEGGDLRFL
ncbi:MAG: helix-turn-helix transcriptional regulator [Actinomycetota bacterium]|nr:helix-turn-helix transcriptional regulator [Actinomycetota bacterium]